MSGDLENMMERLAGVAEVLLACDLPMTLMRLQMNDRN